MLRWWFSAAYHEGRQKWLFSAICAHSRVGDTPADKNCAARRDSDGDPPVDDGYPVSMLSDRHRTALEMRESGATFQAIGDVFGVSASRASAIYQRACDLRLEQEAGLRMRSIRIVRNMQHSTTELATMLGHDREAAFVALLREPTCDRRHAEEILAWLEAGKGELP